MDILFLSSVSNQLNKNIIDRFNRIIREEFSTQSKYQVSMSQSFHMWKLKSGESLLVDNEKYEIWFDGYIHSTGSCDLNEYLTILAERIVTQGKVLSGEESGIFNVIVRDKTSGKLYLANDPGGLFPLYYTLIGNSFFASTHLYLFAKALRAKPDYLQVVAKSTFGYAIGPYTYFEGIRRLLPGELIIYDPESNTIHSQITETYFQGYYDQPKDMLERVYTSFQAPVNRIVEQSPNVGIMLSEGFDSRLLAAAFKKAGANVFSFTHGTNGTKGMHIAERVAQTLGLQHHFEEAIFPSTPDLINKQLFLVDDLHCGFWQAGSSFFSSRNIGVVSAGTALDSTLGGHIFLKPSSEKIQAIYQRMQEVIRQNMGLIQDSYIENLSINLMDTYMDVNTARLTRRIKERFIPDVADLLLPQVDLLKDCIKEEFDRIGNSGADLPSLKLQKFFLEHRARRFAFLQEMTLRMENRLVVPCYEPVFMREIFTVPVKYRLNHGLYLRLLEKFFPKAAALPTGHYALPSTYPRILLESTRVFGKIKDLKIVRNYLLSKGTSDYSGYRGALFMDKNGHDPQLFDYFYLILKTNNVINYPFYKDFLANVESYNNRTYKLEDFYRAIEYNQIFSHTF